MLRVLAGASLLALPWSSDLRTGTPRCPIRDYGAISITRKPRTTIVSPRFALPDGGSETESERLTLRWTSAADATGATI